MIAIAEGLMIEASAKVGHVISYAQYGEDLILWGALSDIRRGFYIDAGASDPHNDSVTRLFYEAGWRGINIEPCRRSFDQISAARPRDLNLKIAASNQSGIAKLYEVEEQPGLSTTVEQLADEYMAKGMKICSYDVPCATLADICTGNVHGEIHFLKIDVEGAERIVLEGADFNRFRPWLLAIEATVPCTYTPSHEEWEHLVFDAGYEFALFNQVNRYYVAREHFDRKGRIQTPSVLSSVEREIPVAA
jgi:FkbM family methyltransferase